MKVKFLKVKKESFIALLFILLSICSCNKKDEDNVLIFITPNPDVRAASGQIITYNVKSYSNNFELVRFRIDIKEDTRFDVIIDSTIRTKNFFYEFDYVTKFYGDNKTLFVRFTAWDAAGNSTTITRELNIEVTDDKILPEKTSLSMYSKSSGGKDAYDILNNELLFSNVGDSAKMDIADTSSATTDALSRVWRSKTGGKFVVFKTGSGFNYSGTTKNMIVNAFNNGVKSDLFNNIQKDDIVILYSQKRDIYAAIQIKDVFDELGKSNDRYVFNIKY